MPPSSTDGSLPDRRKRFVRSAEASHALTPLKLTVLQLIAESRFLSTPQVAALMALSEHAARLHLRDLYDLGMTDVVAVPGVAVGSTALIAAKVHQPTKQGLATLERLNMLPETAKKPGGYTSANFAFLGHELFVRDYLIFLTRLAREHADHAIEHWDCHPDKSGGSSGSVVPDALFRYRLGEKRVAGLVEVDRGTERGTAGDRFDRWAPKVSAYTELFQNPDALRTLMGSPRARLVVTVPTAERAQWVLWRVAGSAVVAQSTWVGVQQAVALEQASSLLWYRPDGVRAPFLPAGG